MPKNCPPHTHTIAQYTTKANFKKQKPPALAKPNSQQPGNVRSCILEEINISQKVATVLSIDNQGAVLMVDAQQPTRKTQHIDIKHLKIQEWVE